MAVAAVASFAGCSSDDGDPAPDNGLITAETVQNALLKASDIGKTWTAPEASSAPATVTSLVSLCGADTPPAGVPGQPQIVAAPLADEGQKGAQSFTQFGLVYEDAVAADTAVATLRTVADACPATVTKPAQETEDRSEPGYTETAKTSSLEEGAWAGFVTLRNKQYEKGHEATADTAVAVLSMKNVVLIDQYAIYRLGTSGASANPQFSSDWQKLVGTTLNRVG